MKIFVWGLLAGIVLALVIPFLVVAIGLINMGATTEPGYVERSLATFAVRRSMALRAGETENPYANDPRALESGLVHFQDTCVQCHGAPGVEPAEFAKGLNPPAPELSEVQAESSDGELFWLVSRGIRMTGMPAFGPTHSDEDIWKIVAFVRHLPRLTPEEKHKLQEKVAGGHQHGGQSEDDRHHDNGESSRSQFHEHGGEREGTDKQGHSQQDHEH